LIKRSQLFEIEILEHINIIFIFNDKQNYKINNFPPNIKTIIYFSKISELTDNLPLGLENLIGSSQHKISDIKLPWNCKFTMML
jgi:hypothetical protein